MLGVVGNVRAYVQNKRLDGLLEVYQKSQTWSVSDLDVFLSANVICEL